MYQSDGASSRDDAVKQKPEELEIEPARQSASASSHDHQEPHKKCALFFQLSGLPPADLCRSIKVCPLHNMNLHATARQDASSVLAIEDLQTCPIKGAMFFFLSFFAAD